MTDNNDHVTPFRENMNRSGEIIGKNNDGAYNVKILKHTACGDCGACQLGDDNKDVIMTVESKLTDEDGNTINLANGDMVEVEMGSSGVLGAAAIMYGIPLISLVVGVMLADFILKGLGFTGNNDLLIALVGIIFSAISFMVIKMNEPKFKDSKKFAAHISRLIQKKEDML